MDSGQDPLVVLSLKYTYLIKPALNATSSIYFQARSQNNSLWRDSKTELVQSPTFTSKLLNSGNLIIDNIPSLRSAIYNLNDSTDKNVSVNLIEPMQPDHNISVTIQGPQNFVNDSRALVLKSYNQVIYKSVRISSSKIINNDNSLNFQLTDMLSKLAQYFNVEILITNFETDFKYNSMPKNIDSDLNIIILGDQDNVSLAEARVRVSLDDLNGLCVDHLDIELCTLPLIGGTNFANFKNVAKLSGANLHLPDILPELFNSQISGGTKDSKIFITGSKNQVLTCKSILKETISGLRFYVKNCVITRVKNDFLCLLNQADIVSIMFQHGVYIQLPPIGDSSSVIVVQGNSSNSVELAINELMLLASTFYDINYQFDLNNGSIINNDFILNYLTSIAGLNLISIVFQNNCFEINGLDKKSIETLSLFENLPINKQDVKSEKFIIKLELSNNQKEFIGGKKNGKLLRIMNQTNILIKYQAFNEYNFFIDIVSDNYNQVINGLKMIENELPFEYTFNIPEAFHRQVIGSGGQTIQTIMRKYNVFIKFSNTYDLAPNSLSFVRYNNVVIRCPFKNSKNIPLVEKELLELVKNCSNSQLTTFFKLYKSHYKCLIKSNSKQNFINNIEKTTSTFINFPNESISKTEIIEIKGNDNQSDQAAKLLKSFLPQVFEFKIANGANFKNVISENNEEFVDKIVVPFSIGLGIEIEILLDEKFESENSFHKILLSYNKDNENELEIGIQELTKFLRLHDFLIIDKGQLKFDPIIKGTAAVSQSPSKFKYRPSQSNYLQTIPLTNVYNSNNMYANYNNNNNINKQFNFNLSPTKNLNQIKYVNQNINHYSIPPLNPMPDNGLNHYIFTPPLPYMGGNERYGP